ncbi:phage integrase family protein, partial [mine drainage metagenome]
AKESRPEPASVRGLNFLSGDRQTYALNLIRDWEAQMRHLDGLKGKSCKAHADNLFRLINHAGAAPWELRKKHVTDFLDSRIDKVTGETLAPATVSVYCSAWRSFQNFLLELDRLNEVLARFKVRPEKFITDENGIAVKKHKANWVPRGWSLSPVEIEAIDEQFAIAIRQALARRSKSLLPLQRDRVMFHFAIHFALRVSELVTVQTIDFRPSHDPRLACFGDHGVLTVTGKNDVTGSIPMREKDVYEVLQWYLSRVRQKLLMRRPGSDEGTCAYDGKNYLTAQLLFPSERGGVINPNRLPQAV